MWTHVNSLSVFFGVVFIGTGAIVHVNDKVQFPCEKLGLTIIKKLQYNRLPTSRQPLEHRILIVYNTEYVQNVAPIWHYSHNGVSVLVADGLMLIRCQGVCNHHEKVGRWPLVRNLLGECWRIWVNNSYQPVVKHIEAKTKWPPFRRRHFQTHFLQWKC